MLNIIVSESQYSKGTLCSQTQELQPLTIFIFDIHHINVKPSSLVTHHAIFMEIAYMKWYFYKTNFHKIRRKDQVFTMNRHSHITKDNGNLVEDVSALGPFLRIPHWTLSRNCVTIHIDTFCMYLTGTVWIDVWCVKMLIVHMYIQIYSCIILSFLIQRPLREHFS